MTDATYNDGNGGDPSAGGRDQPSTAPPLVGPGGYGLPMNMQSPLTQMVASASTSPRQSSDWGTPPRSYPGFDPTGPLGDQQYNNFLMAGRQVPFSAIGSRDMAQSVYYQVAYMRAKKANDLQAMRLAQIKHKDAQTDFLFNQATELQDYHDILSTADDKKPTASGHTQLWDELYHYAQQKGDSPMMQLLANNKDPLSAVTTLLGDRDKYWFTANKGLSNKQLQVNLDDPNLKSWTTPSGGDQSQQQPPQAGGTGATAPAPAAAPAAPAAPPQRTASAAPGAAVAPTAPAQPDTTAAPAAPAAPAAAQPAMPGMQDGHTYWSPPDANGSQTQYSVNNGQMTPTGKTRRGGLPGASPGGDPKDIGQRFDETAASQYRIPPNINANVDEAAQRDVAGDPTALKGLPEDANGKIDPLISNMVKNRAADIRRQLEQISTSGMSGQAAVDAMLRVAPTLGRRVVGWVSGQLPPPSGWSQNQAPWPLLLDLGGAIDPTFTYQTAHTRQHTLDQFASGQDGRNLTAIATAYQHLKSLQNALHHRPGLVGSLLGSGRGAEILSNLSPGLAARLGMSARDQAWIGAIDNDVNTASNEYAYAIGSGHLTNEARNNAMKDLNWRSQSINTVSGNVDSMVVRLHDRMVELQGRFTAGTGYQPGAMQKLFRDSEDSNAIREMQSGPE